MSKLRIDAERYPATHILIAMLLTVGIISLPLDLLFNLFCGEKISLFLSQTMLRTILIVFAVVAIIKYQFKVFNKFSLSGCAITLILALMIVINNFPIIGTITGSVKVIEDGITIFLFVLNCLLIALTEELIFRGIIFPLCEIAFNNKKHKMALSIIVASSIFALTHLINVFNGISIGAVLLQVGYSFLVGAMLCICLKETKNIILCVVLHFIYNIGGLFCDKNIGIATGKQWDTLTIIITIILGVFASVWFVFIALRKNK